jgi:antitoxin YefM
MTIQTTYTQARSNLASLWDEVTLNRRIVIIERRGAEPVALISADELEGLMETAYLLRSPKNAERLWRALGRAQRKEGTPQTTDELTREVGFGEVTGEE